MAGLYLDTNKKMPHFAREETTEQTTLTYSELLVMVISKTLPLLDQRDLGSWIGSNIHVGKMPKRELRQCRIKKEGWEWAEELD